MALIPVILHHRKWISTKSVRMKFVYFKIFFCFFLTPPVANITIASSARAFDARNVIFNEICP